MKKYSSPILYILCGLSFSGKTTYAKKLGEKLSIPIISEDTINAERGLGLQGEHISDRKWEETFQFLITKVQEKLKQGCSIIVDAMCHTQEQRASLRQIARKNMAKSCLIYIQCSKVEARKRWEDNEKSSERFRVHPDDFHRANTLFQHPTKKELALFDEVVIM